MTIKVMQNGQHFGTAAAVKFYHGEDVRRFDQPGEEVDRLVKLAQAQHGVSYERALELVLSNPANAALKHEYAERG